MNITIIGWYGTETIGDRAILAGLFSFFSKVFDNFEIKLGSLYPFLSERTINEDCFYWQSILKKEVKIEIFNSKISKELNRAIKNSEIVIIGGGPLMDIEPMYMLEYGFKKAKKFRKKTAILGCGIGPLFRREYKKCLLNIIKFSDLIILRDIFSRNNLIEIYKEFNQDFNDKQIYTGLDLATQCCLDYASLRKDKISKNDYIAINLRKYPKEYLRIGNEVKINDNLSFFIESIAKTYKEKLIKLIPMHYFHIGGDDREFLNEIKFNYNLKNIYVQNKTLTLFETMQIYQNALFCIGMRFHSILFQTMLNGKNFILDYADPKRGKISGFIDEIDNQNFYKNRHIYLPLSDIESMMNMINEDSIKRIFKLDIKKIMHKLNVYSEKLEEL